MELMKGAVIGVLFLGPVGSHAEEGVGLQELEKRVIALSHEVSKLKQEGAPPAQERHLKGGILFGGYGEIVYRDFTDVSI